MDIYEGIIPPWSYYAVHLFAWMLPIILLQWLGFHRLLWANRRAIFLPTFFVGSYLIATDVVAVHYGVWHFDEALIMAASATNQPPAFVAFILKPFGVPIEEWAFFYLTALLVAQSFVLFLPSRLRREAASKKLNATG